MPRLHPMKRGLGTVLDTELGKASTIVWMPMRRASNSRGEMKSGRGSISQHVRFSCVEFWMLPSIRESFRGSRHSRYLARGAPFRHGLNLPPAPTRSRARSLAQLEAWIRYIGIDLKAAMSMPRSSRIAPGAGRARRRGSTLESTSAASRSRSAPPWAPRRARRSGRGGRTMRAGPRRAHASSRHGAFAPRRATALPSSARASPARSTRVLRSPMTEHAITASVDGSVRSSGATPASRSASTPPAARPPTTTPSTACASSSGPGSEMGCRDAPKRRCRRVAATPHPIVRAPRMSPAPRR